MNKKARLIFFLTGSAIVLSAIFLKLFVGSSDIVSKIDNLRTVTQSKLDSLHDKLLSESKFFDSLSILIQSNKLNDARNIIERLLVKSPRDERLHVLMGEIFESKMQYDSAVDEYTFAIFEDPFSIAVDKRAKVYFILKKYDKALSDYKEEYEVNYDYSYTYGIGRAYEQLDQRDSALKYYNIYLEHYSDSALENKIKLFPRMHNNLLK